MAEHCVLNVFGCPTVRTAGGAEVRFRTKKQLGLFVYLALETKDRGVSRDRLVELFWSDTDPVRGRHSLSQAFFAVRERFGADALTRGRGPVTLLIPVETELDKIESQGNCTERLLRPLDDLECAGGIAFSHWVDSTRHAINLRAKAVLETALAAAAERGRVDRVREHAAQLYRVDPLNSSAVNALTDQLLERGDQVGAMRLLQEHAKHVTQTIGDTPQEIQRRMGRIRKEMDTKVAPHEPAFATSPEVFVGRVDEVAELEVQWAEALRGDVVAVAVYGPHGVGKSALLRHFTRTVRERAWPAFAISCPEIGAHIPFGATSELIQALILDPSVAGTDPIWLAEASRVSPGLRARYPGIPEAPTVPAEAVRLRVAEAVSRMVDAITDNGPVLIAVDDLDHMDPTSRDVLHLFLRRRAHKATMLLCSARSSQLRTLGALGEDPLSAVAWTARMGLEQLDSKLTDELVVRLSINGKQPDSAVRNEIARVGEGNPYLTEMLLSDWQRDPDGSLIAAEMRGDAAPTEWHPSDKMRHAFARQYQGLSEDAEDAANLLAVAGRGVGIDGVGDVLGLERRASSRAILELVNRGLVRYGNTALEFKNEMHRRFVYFAMDEDVRLYMHARIGAFLAGNADSSQLLLAAAHHAHKGGDIGSAIDMATRGAGEAIRGGAPSEAEMSLQSITSTRLEGGDHLVVLLAEARIEQGRYQQGIDTLDSMVESELPLAWQARAAVLRTEALYRGALTGTTQISEAADVALRLATALSDDDLLIRALQTRAEIAADMVDRATLQRVSDIAKRLGGNATGKSTRARARASQAFCHLVAGEYRDAADLLQSATQILRTERLDIELRKTTNGLGICLTNLGQYEEATRCFQIAIALADRIGDPGAAGLCWHNLAVAYQDLGHFQEARTAFVAAAKSYSGASRGSLLPDLLLNAAALAIILGNEDETELLLEQAEVAIEKQTLARHRFGLLVTRADSYLSLRRFEDAWEIVEELLRATKDATPLDAASIHIERLRRYFTWATRGYGEMKKTLQPLEHRGIGNPLAQLVEIGGLEEWIQIQEGDCKRPGHTRGRISKLGLYGVAARLVAAGVFPDCSVADGPSAQLVTEMFPECRDRLVPTAVDVLR